MYPIVERIILIACIASILSPIIPLFKFIVRSHKEMKLWEAWVDLVIKDFLANPKHYKSWKGKKL
ncbi:hypothetical protein SAMN05216311_11479 [Chitinophaga sp. CF418]|nr:hypothetical protein SAMN05216311_11479 [Chitinophaga sp. CF418]